MATTGAKFPTLTGSNRESPWSDNAWVNPDGILSDNANYASVTATTYDSPDQTWVLKGGGFGFEVPGDATILGVECKINCWYANGTVSIDLCQLMDTSAQKVGTNLCATPEALGTSNAGIVTKGGASNLWGNALTPAWVNHANFGIAIGMLSTGTDSDVFVDYATLEITYQVADSASCETFMIFES